MTLPLAHRVWMPITLAALCGLLAWGVGVSEAAPRLPNGMQSVVAGATLREVTLQPGNVLQGSVVDDAGMPQANYEVWIAPEQGTAVKTRTDASGRFEVRGVAPGIYSIDTPCGGGKFRLWESKDAPRDAESSVLLVVCAKGMG